MRLREPDLYDAIGPWLASTRQSLSIQQRMITAGRKQSESIFTQVALKIKDISTLPSATGKAKVKALSPEVTLRNIDSPPATGDLKNHLDKAQVS